MKDQENLLGMAEKALHDFLKNIPGIKLSLVKKNIAQELYQPDLILKVQWQNIEKLIIVEVKSRGEARQAREAAYTLINLLNRYKADYSLFIAPYISADAKKLFDSENIGYLDFSDNGKFNIGDIYIEKEGGVNKHAEKRRLRTLYSTMASRVLRGLLSEPGKEWRTVELAKVADVSLGLVSNVRKLLRERVWIRE